MTVNPPRTLILCRPDRVGDVLIATACLPAVQRALPATQLIFAACAAMQPVLENHPLLAAFVPIDAPSAGELAERFRRCEADAIVILHPAPDCAAAALAAGIPRRIGYQGGAGLTASLPDLRATGARHEAEANFDLLALLGVPPPQSRVELLRPQVHLAPASRGSLRQRLAAVGWPATEYDSARYAVLNPTAHSLDLRWPAQSFLRTGRALLASGAVDKIVLVAPAADDPSLREICCALTPTDPAWIDLGGQTDLAELGWLLRGARILISRNTGTTHLAAAVDCPTVELFGRLEPRYGPARWRALGQRIEIVTAPSLARGWFEGRRRYWRRCHAAISEETVLRRALRLLGAQPIALSDAD